MSDLIIKHVPLEADDDGGWTEYMQGDARLIIEDDGHGSLMALGLIFSLMREEAGKWQRLRDLARLLSHPVVQRAIGLKVPEVRLERYVSEPDIVGGAVQTGWSFLAGEGEGKAEVFFSDRHVPWETPLLVAFDLDFKLHEVERQLAAVVALLADPRVQEARQRWADGLPAVEA